MLVVFSHKHAKSAEGGWTVVACTATSYSILTNAVQINTQGTTQVAALVLIYTTQQKRTINPMAELKVICMGK